MSRQSASVIKVIIRTDSGFQQSTKILVKRGRTFEELGIQVASTATDGDKYVKGWAYFPDGFVKGRKDKYRLIITLSQG